MDDCMKWINQLKSYKGWFKGEAGGDGERRVEAAEDGAKQHELPDAHVDGQAGQVVAQRGQLLIHCQSPQVLQALLGRIQAALGRGLDEPREDRVQRLLSKNVQDFNSGTEKTSVGGGGLHFLCLNFSCQSALLIQTTGAKDLQNLKAVTRTKNVIIRVDRK